MKTKVAYWTCQVAGWGAYSAMGAVAGAQQVGWRFSLVAGWVLFFLYSIALTDLFRREIRRRQWLTAPSRRTYARVFGAAVLVAAVQTFLVISIDWLFEGERSVFLHLAATLAAWAGITVITILWTIFYIALTGPRRYQEKEVRLQLALREAELRALEAEINPHFLFNCLNSIRGLVAENPAVAQDMITRLANILRYNLHRDLMHTVPLASEVEAVADYLALESVRLEDRLRVQFDIAAEAGQVPIPPMLLQTLVENALKHGIAKLPEGGDVVIRAAVAGDRLLVEVENSGQLAEAEPEPGATQLGLNNTRERLRILYGDRASLQMKNRDGDRVAATVLIPRTA
ncbi:MAG: histidine kinase [Bryobacteraceae bacterium]|jgi:sensor histidine kinase YesM